MRRFDEDEAEATRRAVAKCLRSASEIPTRDGVDHAARRICKSLRQSSEDASEQSARQDSQGKHGGCEEEESYLLQEISAFAEATEGRRAIALGAFIHRKSP